MRTPVAAEARFTRPSNTTAYTSGDLVANSTTVGSVVPMQFKVTNGGPNAAVMIRRARIRKSDPGVTTASFRLHLWNQKPTPATNGDNGALIVTDLKSYLGYFDFTLTEFFTDGAFAFAVPAVGSEILTSTHEGSIYGLLEARSAYTPVSAEVFNVQLEILQD